MRLINWYQTLSISDNFVQCFIRNGLQYIDLSYVYKEEQLNYQIELTSTKSNLGVGKLWYFICPHTKKRCRKLHLIGKYFLHRTAYRKIYYASQERSPHDRLLHKFPTATQAQKLINSKYFRKFYNGKPTKRYAKCMRQIREANNASMPM